MADPRPQLEALASRHDLLLVRNPAPFEGTRLDLRWYLAASAPFYLIFVGSIGLTFLDIEATRAATVGFGFPGWVVLPQGIAKVLGLAAILSRQSRLLTGRAETARARELSVRQLA